MPSRSPEIDAIIAATPDWRGEVAARLRDIVHIADPEVVEAAKWKRPSNPMGAPVFEHNGLLCTIAILKERVRLTMAEGAQLPDPHGLYNAALEGSHMRGIDVREGEVIDQAALVEIVRAGVGLNLAKPARRK